MKTIILISFLLLTFGVSAQKISSMPAVTTLSGTEMIPVVQSGINKRSNPSQIKAYIKKDADTVAASSIPTIPTIFSYAGDTSNYAVPGKIGNIFIDTINSKVYISKSATRNGWLKLN